MKKPPTFRQIALGVSLPTFAVSPAVAKATIYMPSQVAARTLGGRSAEHRCSNGIEVRSEPVGRDKPHAA